MHRETIEQVRALIEEVDALACDVLVDLDMQNEYEIGGWKKLDHPRPASPTDYITCGNVRTAALRRRSMDLTRKLSEMRKPS